MMLPKDRPLYTNLGTSFTDFDQLLAELQSTHTTGYLTATFPGYEGIVLLSAGDVANALETAESGRTSGPAARAAIQARVRGKGGTICVYGLAPELVGLLSVLLESDVVFHGLDTSFANPDRLLARLRDEGHTGHLEFELPEGRGDGIIFMRTGQVIESVFTQDGQSVSGPDTSDSIIQAAASYGAVFHVYRATGVRPTSAPPAPRPIVAETPRGGPGTGAGNGSGRNTAVASPAVAVAGPELVGAHAGPAAAVALPANVTPMPVEPQHTADSKETMSFWSEMLSRAEAAIDKLSNEGRFAEAFKEVMVEKAGTYPYLDPFAAEFEYRCGSATFNGPVPANLNEALADCLQDTIARLAFRMKRADLETRVRAELSEMNWSHASMIQGFSPAMQALVS